MSLNELVHNSDIADQPLVFSGLPPSPILRVDLPHTSPSPPSLELDVTKSLKRKSRTHLSPLQIPSSNPSQRPSRNEGQVEISVGGMSQSPRLSPQPTSTPGHRRFSLHHSPTLGPVSSSPTTPTTSYSNYYPISIYPSIPSSPGLTRARTNSTDARIQALTARLTEGTSSITMQSNVSQREDQQRVKMHRSRLRKEYEEQRKMKKNKSWTDLWSEAASRVGNMRGCEIDRQKDFSKLGSEFSSIEEGYEVSIRSRERSRRREGNEGKFSVSPSLTRESDRELSSDTEYPQKHFIIPKLNLETPQSPQERRPSVLSDIQMVEGERLEGARTGLSQHSLMADQGGGSSKEDRRSIEFLEGRSLFLFGPENPLRLALWRTLRWRWTESIIFMLIILNWLFLVARPVDNNTDKSVFGASWADYPILATQICFTMDIIIRVIVYGLFFNPSQQETSNISLNANLSNSGFRERLSLSRQYSPDHPNFSNSQEDYPTYQNARPKLICRHTAYLRNFSNVLDMISMLSYWIDFSLMLSNNDKINLFKALGAMRPLKLLALTDGTAVILRSIESALPLLASVLLFIMFLLMLFGLIGLQNFQGAMMRYCVVPSINVIGDVIIAQPPRNCGGYYNGTTLFGPYTPLQTSKNQFPRPLSYICPTGQICQEMPGQNQQQTFVNYDNFYYAFLTVFTVVSMESWTNIMYWTMDAESTWAGLFYCACIYILAWLMVPLFIAGITYSFARVRAASRHGAFTNNPVSGRQLLRAKGDDWLYYDNDEDDEIESRTWSFKFVRRLLHHPWYPFFGGCVVGLDLIAMCMQSFYTTPLQSWILDQVELAFTLLFAFEILLRLACSGRFSQFWSYSQNRVDLVLALGSCVIQLPFIHAWSGYCYFTAFQILRSYRLVHCFPRVKTLSRLVIGSVDGVINLTLFTFLCLFLFTPMFIMMFGGDFDNLAGASPPYLQFDNLGQAFLSLFVILTGENWVAVLYNGMESQGAFGSVYAAIFFLVFYCISHYIVLNMFVAIVLENFDLDDDEIRELQFHKFIQENKVEKNALRLSDVSIFAPLMRSRLSVRRFPNKLVPKLTKSKFKNELFNDPINRPKPAPFFLTRYFKLWFWDHRASTDSDDKTNIKRNSLRFPFRSIISSIVSTETTVPSDDEDANGLSKVDNDDYEHIVNAENKQAMEEDLRIWDNRYDRTLFMFGPHHWLRAWCCRIVGSNADSKEERRNPFNIFILLCVCLSIVVVIVDLPPLHYIERINNNIDISDMNSFVIIDLLLLSIFSIEIILRVLANGLILTPHAYLRLGWNQFDFAIVVVNWVAIFIDTSKAYGFPRFMRITRVFRILRIVRYFEGMRSIFYDLIQALPAMIDVTILSLIVLSAFALYGVQIFSGRFYMCNDPNVVSAVECVGEFMLQVTTEVQIPVPRCWSNPYDYSFDTFPRALLHLYELATSEGWVDSLFTGMRASPEVGIQPLFTWDSATNWNAIYYVVFMFLGYICIAQLFIGVIVETFKRRSGMALQTLEQRRWNDLQQQLQFVSPSREPKEHKSGPMKFCSRLIKNKDGKFEKFITCVLLLNVLMVASEFYQQPTILDQVKDSIFFISIVVYDLETIIKIIGLGYKKWIKSRWNIYAGVVSAFATAIFIWRYFDNNPESLYVKRFSFIAICFRIASKFHSLKILFHAVARSLPSIVNISAVFAIVLILYAIVMMEIFGLTKYGQNGNDYVNFRSFQNALLLLIRMTTGESWDYVMHDFQVQAPYCVGTLSRYLESDCGSEGGATFLFVSFYTICTYIFLNLFIAVILSNFSYVYEKDAVFTIITNKDLKCFKKAWIKFDKDAKGFIQKKDVAGFLRNLENPNCAFSVEIYKPAYSIKTLRSLLDLNPQRRPSHESSNGQPSFLNIAMLNSYLATMDVEEVQFRRNQYNLIYTEILWSATSKGISFGDMIHILVYKFVNIEKALGIDTLLRRLEKQEELRQYLSRERAKGFLLKLIQRKRYLAELHQSTLGGHLQIPQIVVNQATENRTSRVRPPQIQTSSLQTHQHPSLSPITPNIMLSSPPSATSSPPSSPGWPAADSLSFETKFNNESQSTPSTDTLYHVLSFDPNSSLNPMQVNYVISAMNDNVWAGILSEEYDEEVDDLGLRVENSSTSSLREGV